VISSYPGSRVAIVTGGAGSIGSAISSRLAADGYHVVIGYLSAQEPATKLATELHSLGYSATAVRADVTEACQVSALFEDTTRHQGHIDVVVNNAGTAQWQPIAELDAPAYEKVFGVNVLGALNVLRAASRHLADWGRVVNVSSTLVRAPVPGSGAYAASKAALEQLGKVAALELGGRFITVNSVRIGPTEPGLLGSLTAQRQPATSPFGRLGQPQDAADVVSFLVSDAARWITGQVITADGGACSC
jgi:3-oxoacyl-[acyl-carrier protein] reductase